MISVINFRYVQSSPKVIQIKLQALVKKSKFSKGWLKYLDRMLKAIYNYIKHFKHCLCLNLSDTSLKYFCEIDSKVR